MPGDPPASSLPRSDSPASNPRQETTNRVQATRLRPDTRPTDMRRLAAAALSALIPGLGQLFNGRRRLAVLFLTPSLILLALGALIVGSQSGPRLAAWIISPQVLGTLLMLNLLVLAWRLFA